MTDRETSIRQQLNSQLSGELTRAEFTDWFVIASRGVDLQNDPGASRLTYVIELALAERADNVLTVEEFTTTLRGEGANLPTQSS
ncbi:MAG: hypothetical protein U0075_06010 [Thermomicrobiales bacterium]